MASNGSNSSSQPLIPIFKGERYDLWSLKMKTMFRFQELWDLVETGGRDDYRGRGCGNGRGRGQFGEQRQNKNNIMCRYCKKLGHIEVDCWTKQREDQKQANFREEVEVGSKLFMTQSFVDDGLNEVWFMDSGCSNHKCGTRSFFKDLDKSLKSEVRLGDNKPVKVEGNGTIAIKTNQGNVKLLHDVQYVPNLAHNLSSVGKLVTGGYTILFDECCCNVYDNKYGQSIVNIFMTQNHMFPLEVSSVRNCVLIVK
ncbi:hypothetical protein KY284_022028 [Solanum tuberosum]|nr:hypothetical protein KY284_022028 [Solanum tuberosum]